MARKDTQVVDFLSTILPDDPALQNEVEEQITRRSLVHALVFTRNNYGITQAQVAERLGCRQSRISKLENGYDDDLRVRDIRAYAQAIDANVVISLEPGANPAVAGVRYHLKTLVGLLRELQELAGYDEQIATGVLKFHHELLMLLAEVIAKSTERLPGVRTSGEVRVDIGSIPKQENQPAPTPGEPGSGASGSVPASTPA